MKKLLLLTFALCLFSELFAQEGIFKKQENFPDDVRSLMKRSSDSSANGLAESFTNTWESRLTPEQQKLVFDFSAKMYARGMSPDPHLKSMWACIDQGVRQGSIKDEQLTKFVQVAEATGDDLAYSVKIYPKFFYDILRLLRERTFYRSNYSYLKPVGNFELTFGHARLDGEIAFASDTAAAGEEIDTTPLIPHVEPEGDLGEVLSVPQPEGTNHDPNDDGWGEPVGGWGDGWDTGNSGTGTSDDGWSTAEDVLNGTGNDSWGNSGGGTLPDLPDKYAGKYIVPQQYATHFYVHFTRNSKDKRGGGKGKVDYLRMVKPEMSSTYFGEAAMPASSGPYIKFSKTTLELGSIHDTIRIKDTEGYFIPMRDGIVAEGGRVDWPHKDKTGEVYCEFGKYFFDVRAPNLRVEGAKLTHTGKLEKPADGLFEYKSVKDNKGKNPYYPRFASYYGDNRVKSPLKDVQIVGGLSLVGKRISTRNLRRDKSRIEILRDGEIHVSAAAREPFVFTDSTVQSQMAEFKVYFNRRDTLGGTLDSITHPGVSLLFLANKNEIHARRFSEVYNTVPFMNSYHKIEMHIDKLRWKIDEDSLYAYVMSAANMVPAVIESQNFFHESRLRALQGVNSQFHPLAAPVRFAQALRTMDDKGGIKEFSLKAMAEVLGLNPITLRGASSEMTRLGYLNYDPFLEWISLTDKGLLYSNAPLLKQDFDRIRFLSYDSLQKNMVLSFSSNDLVINGVDSIMVRIPPADSDAGSRFMYGKDAAEELLGDLTKSTFDGGYGMGLPQAEVITHGLQKMLGQHFRDSSQMKRAMIDAIGLDNTVKYMDKIFQVSRKDKMAVFLHPGNRQVIMKKNRNFTFDGKLTASTYANFYGKEFQFDYDSFAVKMVKIDSAALMITDTLTGQFKEMTNKIKETTGKFELSHFTNRSGMMPKNRLPRSIRDMKWPIFRLEGDAHVDFADSNVLGGAYAADSSVRFDLRPFAKDDLGRKDNREDGGLDGNFRSGNIFPDFEEKLQVQRDGSFGFVHDIMGEAAPEYREAGYPLYKDSLKSDRQTARFQGQIVMNNQGIRSQGEIKYLTAKLNSNDFVYYPDKVTVYGPEAANGKPEFGGETVYSFGEIEAGVFEGTPYPDVKMDPFVMNWNIKQDEMLLSDTTAAFMMYHKATKPIRNDQSSTFHGTLSLNPLRLAGSGILANLGSEAKSDQFKFEQTRYEARNAEFVVLSEDVLKPGVKAVGVAVDYDMTTRQARLTSEGEKGSISFPYTAYKTSIAEALWDFDKKEVDMTDEGRTTPAVFSSTREDQAGLEFNARGAHYDLTDYTLNISGADSIFSVDSYIYPHKSEVVVRKNAEMDSLINSRLTVNAYERYHKLKDGRIKISSREKFNGNAIYIYINDAKDTFLINFDRFDVETKTEEATGEKSLRTVAGSVIKEEDNFIKQIGVQYKGKVQMIADSISLIYDGYNKFTDSESNPWIKNDPESEFIIITHREQDERKRDLGSGVFISRKSGNLYTATRTPINDKDADFFKADGAYRKIPSLSRDVIEPQNRGTWFRESKGIAPEITSSTFRGNKFSYNSTEQKAEFEGRFDFFEPKSDFRLLAGGSGRADYSNAMYSLNLLTILDFGEDAKDGVFKTMADDLERFRGGFKSAINYNKMTQETYYATANILTEPDWLKFFEKAQRGKAKFDDEFPNALTLNGVNLHWSEKHKAFFSTGKLGLIHIFKKELNIKTDGYLEIIPGDGKPEVNLYLKFVDQAWYMISYRDGKIFLLGSNFDFNTEVDDPKAKHKYKILPDEDKNNFLGRFRSDYLGQGGSFDSNDTIQDLDDDGK